MYKTSIILVFFLTFSNVFSITTPKEGNFPNGFWSKMESRNIGNNYGNPGWIDKINNYKKSSTRDSQLEFNVPVLLGKYSDVSTTYFEANDFQNLLFENNPSGTMKEYFSEISYGNFTLNGQSSGWYGSSMTKSQAVENTREYVANVASLADPDFDFGLYDNDGPDNIPNSGDDDGYVDGIIVVYPGCLDGDDNIWAHQSSLSSNQYVTNDLAPNGENIIIDTYMVCPELSGGQGQGCLTNEIFQIGTFSHEFGHVLGLPDLYDRDDTDGNSEGVGEWCLMASANWLGLRGNRPGHMSSWCKIEMGWMEATVADNNLTEISIAQLATSPTAIKIWEDDYRTNRYFLIENRQKVGFDSELNGSGLMIYHIDENKGWGSNGWSWGSVNDDEENKFIDLESADGNLDLDNEVNRGDLGDPFPGSTGNTTFNNTSNPSSNRNNGFQTDISITNISESDSLMSANIMPMSNSGYAILYDENGISPTSLTIGADEQWSGVVFDSDRAGFITEIDFGVVYEGFWNTDVMDWEVFLYDSFDGQSPGNLMANIAGSSVSGGWNTIQIDSVEIGENQEFFVAIKFTNNGYVYCFDATGELSGRSYFSSDGSSYNNQLSLYGDANIRTKISTEVFNSNDTKNDILPNKITLKPNYPNPFNPLTTLSFTLVYDSKVKLDIYDINGRKVDELINSNYKSGTHYINWNANFFSSGVYFAFLSNDKTTITQKMILLK